MTEKYQSPTERLSERYTHYNLLTGWKHGAQMVAFSMQVYIFLARTCEV